MDRYVWLILCFLVTTSAASGNQTNSKTVQEVFDFLEECSKNFTLGEQKDVVVTLGTTGSGKSTLTLLLIGVKLTSIETIEGSGDFIIIDEKGIISPPENSTQSQTMIPNLNIDKQANMSYYDCAGFEDSRGVDHDLAVTFLVQKLLKFTNSVKFMFTIPYSSVKMGGDRHDFKKLVRHATALIKNIEKYRNAVGIIVTKAETRISNGKIVQDDKVVESVTVFMNQTRKDLEAETPEVRANMEKFIDILLEKQDNKFSRIQVLRSPTESGNYNEMEFPKQERQAIKTMLDNTLKYTNTMIEDFGFSISSESKLMVHELFAQLERNLMTDVIGFATQLRDHYSHAVTQTEDKKQIISTLLSGKEELSHVTADDLDLFKQQISNATSDLRIVLSAESLEKFDRHIGFVHFLTSVSDVKLSRGFKISAGLKNITEYLDASIEQFTSALIKEIKEKLAKDESNLNAELKSFYFRKETEISDINTLHELVSSHFNTLSTVTSKEVEVFSNRMAVVLDSLHVQISNEVLKSLQGHIEDVWFIDSLNKNSSSLIVSIESGLTGIIQYLSGAKEWYRFSINLQNELSQYKVQQNIAGINKNIVDTINKLITQTEKDNSDVIFKDTGIKEFVDQINGQINAGMENVRINSVKLKSLRNLLQKSLMTPIATECKPNELVVKGFNVKMSEVMTLQCAATLTKVMAVNKIFFDANVNKPGNQFQVIAPIWEIVGEHSIELHGTSGEAYTTLPPDVATGQPGAPGQPGKPGNQGGHFFGIGDTFISGQTLKIISNGGIGGNGQGGGKGGDGLDGTSHSYTKSKKGFWPWEKRKTWYYTVTDREATPSGKGGDGGCGGLGGIPGHLAVVGLKGASNIILGADRGPDGPPGKGGTAKETNDAGSYVDHNGNRNWIKQPNHFKPPFGNDGGNCATRTQPVESPVTPRPGFMNEFKVYARDNLANNVLESNLRKFIQDIENHNEVHPTYDILSFTNEMVDLENQFWNLRNKFTMRPFYESLLKRLSLYETKVPEADIKRKVLGYLYAAIMGQLNSNIPHLRTIINLREYLNEAQTHVSDIRVIGREIDIRKHQVEYTTLLFNKMAAAKDLIQQKILPKLDDNLKTIELHFVDLVDETLRKKEHIREKKREYEDALDKLKHASRMQGIFGGLKIFSQVLSFLGPYGAIAGKVIGAGTAIAEAATNKKIDQASIQQITGALGSVKEALQESNKLFMEQLKDIAKEAETNANLKDLLEPIRKMQAVIADAEKTGSFVPVVNARNELRELMKNKQITVKKDFPNDITLGDLVDKFTDVSSIVGMSVGVYNQMKSSGQSIKQVAEAIRACEQELKALDLYQARIFDTMIPMFKMVEDYLKGQKPGGESLPELDVRKWEITTRLGDIKRIFSQWTASSGTHDDFQQYFEKVQATMDVLIDVYDRIESISEHRQFADYIANIASNGNNITTDPQLMDTINRMDLIIQSNLLLEMHEFVVKAFKQHYFPFAPLFLDKFYLPPNLSFNDTEALRQNAIKQIRDLNSGVVISDATLGSKDINLFGDLIFDSNKSSLLPPFYVWNNSEFKNQIHELFKGEEISIKADIKGGVDRNSIKFNRIGIKFKASNQTIQTELDAAIQSFDLIMSMVGNNYYRCDNRVYHLPVDGNIIIQQSLKLDADGIPVKQNDVYKKISESNYFLSPYALWNIKLESGTLNTDLSKFANEIIDMELVGRGQYLKSTESISRDVCNDHLNNYYNID